MVTLSRKYNPFGFEINSNTNNKSKGRLFQETVNKIIGEAINLEDNCLAVLIDIQLILL